MGGYAVRRGIGTDGFGRSDTRAQLRRFFEVDAECTVIATLYALAEKGQIERRVVEKAIADKKLTEEQAKTLTFKQGDVLKMKPEDFKDVDVVTLYLLPDVNLQLKPVLQKGLKPGSRIVSHDFDMGDWKADKQEQVQADRGHTIFLWTIK